MAIASEPAKPATVPARRACATSAGTSSPSGSRTPPRQSATATTLPPRSWRKRHAQEPTLPKPWTAKVLPRTSPAPASARYSSSANTTPRPVASSRPFEPKRSTGLPVTTAGEKPWNFEYSSMIHAITCAFVFTSGAGMSVCGPMMSWICSTKRRVTRSSSRGESREGSTAIPPLAPP